MNYLWRFIRSFFLRNAIIELSENLDFIYFSLEQYYDIMDALGFHNQSGSFINIF